jgi:hypothetical protein
MRENPTRLPLSTARYGFAIPKTHVGSTLQLEVAPDWDY